MTKSLFDNSEPKPPNIEELKKIFMIKDEDILIKIDNPDPNEIKACGSFFKRGEELFSDIRIELDVRNPKYSEYHKKLKDLLKEAEKEHVLLSTSGI